jgi:hypothetical protein
MGGERTVAPRVVVVRRPSEYEQLLARHATRGQAAFFLTTRGEAIEPVERLHERLAETRRLVLGAIPAQWRRVERDRAGLDRVLVEPGARVGARGQDGLVANTAQ